MQARIEGRIFPGVVAELAFLDGAVSGVGEGRGVRGGDGVLLSLPEGEAGGIVVGVDDVLGKFSDCDFFMGSDVDRVAVRRMLGCGKDPVDKVRYVQE